MRVLRVKARGGGTESQEEEAAPPHAAALPKMASSDRTGRGLLQPTPALPFAIAPAFTSSTAPSQACSPSLQYFLRLRIGPKWLRFLIVNFFGSCKPVACFMVVRALCVVGLNVRCAQENERMDGRVQCLESCFVT